MKSMLQIIASVACTLALTACGGGSNNTATTTPTVAQPEFKQSDNPVGTGAVAANNDLLAINYTGWLYDASKADFKGAKIDSSIDRGTPLTFTLGTGQQLPGWDQGLVGMRAGGKRTLILPASLAFGATARDAIAQVGTNVYAPIPANSPLIYEVQLISVTKAISLPVVTVTSVDTLPGTGAQAVTGKTVSVAYTGWLYDSQTNTKIGTAFDSSTSFAFTLGAGTVIKGWDQGVPGMLVGGKRTLTIPPELAYGVLGKGTTIPSNATLIFDIELLSVK